MMILLTLAMAGWITLEWNSMRSATRIHKHFLFDIEQNDRSLKDIQNKYENKLSEVNIGLPETSDEQRKITYELKLIKDHYSESKRHLIEQRNEAVMNALRYNLIWKRIPE